MSRALLLLALCACGRTNLMAEPDAGVASRDAGTEEDTGSTADAGPCIPGQLTQRPLLLLGPRITLPQENPKMLDGVATPAGRVLAMLDPENERLILLGPGWVREVPETTTQLARVHLAWNGHQLALTWQAGRRLMFALFDEQGSQQHLRELTNTTQQDEAVAGFAGGTWVPVWSHGLNTLSDTWATRIYPDGGDQTLTQKLTNQSLRIGFPASGAAALVTDAGVVVLSMGETSSLAFANLQPNHRAEVTVSGSRGRGTLVDRGDGGITAIFFGDGPNSRRPDLLRLDVLADGGVHTDSVYREPSLFSLQDVAAAHCAGNVVIAFTDDTTGAGPCIGNYCTRPLVHVLTGFDGGDWRSGETDGGHVRGVTVFRNGDAVDVAWLSASEDGTARLVVAPSLVNCCAP